ncbi:MAG: MFS transporter [Hansschlegelia sp.]
MTASSPTAAAESPAARRHAIAAATVGNGLEWFDFTVYGFFTPIIARLFFPAGEDLTSILLTVGTYGVGFFMRPVGAVVLGVYADTHGRKAALTLTILLMAAGTALLGLAPTYAQAGIVGPLVIVVARLIQGFSAGGEIGGATAFLIEHAPPERRGFFASWQQTSQAIAVVLGGVCGAIVTRTLDPASIDAWGWRVPFLFGLLIGPVGFYIRARVDETPVFADATREKSKSPLLDTLRRHPRGVASGFGVTILWTVCTYVLLFYMTTYAVKQLGMSLADAFVATTVGGVFLMVGCPIAGAVSDRVGRKRMLIAAAAAIGLSIIPLLAWVNAAPTLARLTTVQCALALMLAAFTGPAPAVLAEQFPASLRSTGLSLAYNFAVTIFGGFAAVIVTLLIEATGSKLAPGFYVAAAAAVSALTLLMMRDRTGEPID